jgi:hypothetical protein
VNDRGIHAGFVAGDEVHGGLELRRSIRERGTGYVLAFRSNHMVTRPTVPQTSTVLVAPGSRTTWPTLTV